VNNEVNAKLVSTSVGLIKTLSPQFLTELYAGAGNFTFPLIAALPELRVESVEMNPKLTAFSTKKLTDLKLQKKLFAFTSDCESFVERRELSKELILLDPPRSGCSDSVIDKIIAADSKNLLYISCHPVFLARDLKKLLISNPEYKISHLQIFDMFPQTDHFETLVLLSK
jgi:23S rRNA (uracil1939-C5)-methyltransferase